MSPFLPTPRKQDLTFNDVDFSVLNDILWVQEITIENNFVMRIRGILKTSDIQDFDDLIISEIMGRYLGLLHVLEGFPVFHYDFPELNLTGRSMFSVTGTDELIDIRGEVILALGRKPSAKTT